MTDKIMTLLVGLLIALGGWSLSRTFELSTIQAVHEDKVDKLERQVDKLSVKMDDLKDKEKVSRIENEIQDIKTVKKKKNRKKKTKDN